MDISRYQAMLLFFLSIQIFFHGPLLGTKKQTVNSIKENTKKASPKLCCPIKDCEYEKKAFSNKHALADHILKSHQLCPWCKDQKAYLSTKLLHLHIVEKHPDTECYLCTWCTAYISTQKGQYNRHEPSCKKKISLINKSMNDENIKTSKPNNVRESIKENSKKSSSNLSCFIKDCKYERKTFSNKYKLNNHIISHQLCPWCNDKKSYQSPELLHLHIGEKHGDRKGKCYLCEQCKEYITILEANYNRHIDACKNGSQLSHKSKNNKNSTTTDSDLNCFVKSCKHEKKSFTNKYTLNDHILSTHQLCPWCKDKKSYQSTKLLYLHIVDQHGNGKSYLCEQCKEYITTRKNNYYRHKDACKKKFTSTDKSTKKENTKKTSTELNCFINDCEHEKKAFNNKWAFNEHILKAHQLCPWCKDKTIYQSQKSLHLHIVEKHPDVQCYVCTKCEKGYITTHNSHYKQHQNSCKKRVISTNKPTDNQNPKKGPSDLSCFINDCEYEKKAFCNKNRLTDHIIKAHKLCPWCKDKTIYQSPKSLHCHIVEKHPDSECHLCEWCTGYISVQRGEYNRHQNSCKKKPQLAHKSVNDTSTNNETKAEIQENNQVFETKDNEQTVQELCLDDEMVELEDISQTNNATVSLQLKALPHPGIKNQNGSDCFINASLQILSNIPDFESQLHEQSYAENSIHGKLIAFLNRLRTEENALAGSKDLRKYIVDNTDLDDLKNMESGQHDAQEFLSILLSLFKDELKSVFEMEHESRVTCNTGCYKNQTVDPSWIFTLPIPHQSDAITLCSLITNFFGSTEKIEDFSCLQCHERGARRITTLKTLPQVLVAAPKRFEYDQDKKQSQRINTPISTEEVIVLDDATHTVTYQLIGVISHTGTVEAGHYVSYVKDSNDNTWYEYDDAQATKTSIDLLTKASKNPYLYFYKCIDKKIKTYACSFSKCTDSKMLYSTKAELNNHTVMMHRACPWCDDHLTFSYSTALSKHITEKHAHEDDYQLCLNCDICEEFITTSSNSFEQHKKFCKNVTRKNTYITYKARKRPKDRLKEALKAKQNSSLSIENSSKESPKQEPFFCNTCKKPITTSLYDYLDHEIACNKTNEQEESVLKKRKENSTSDQSTISRKKRKISDDTSALQSASLDLHTLSNAILFQELKTVASEHETAYKNADALQQTEQNIVSLADTILDIDASDQASKNILSLINAASDLKNETQTSFSPEYASFFDEPELIDKLSDRMVNYSHEDPLPILSDKASTSLPAIISNNHVSFFDEPGIIDNQNKKIVNYSLDKENQNLEQEQSSNNIYRCGQYPLCMKVFNTALELVEHYKQKHLANDGESDEDNTPLEQQPKENKIVLDKRCLDCPMQFATHNELTQHYANEHNKWVHDCACGFFAFRLADLTTHQQTTCKLHQAPIHSCANSELLNNTKPLEAEKEIEKVQTSNQIIIDSINKPASPEVIAPDIQEINQKPNNQSVPKKDISTKPSAEIKNRTQKRNPRTKAQTSRPLKKRKNSQNKSTPLVPEKRTDANLTTLANTALFDELRTVASEHEAAYKDAETLQQTQQNLLSLAETVLDIDASKKASKNILSLINAASDIENTTHDKEPVLNNNQESSDKINQTSKVLPHQQPIQFIQIEVLQQTTYEEPANRSTEVHKLLKNENNLCGLFARFNVESFMKELGNHAFDSIDVWSKDALDRFTQKLCNAQNFDAWIDKHKNALTSIKQSNKNSLGMLHSLQIQKIPESENFLIIEFDELKDDLKIFREHMIIDAIHRFRDTHKPQGILINIEKHWIVLVITEHQTWIMDSLGTAHVDDQGHIKNESIALIDRRFRSDYFPAWKDYMQVRSEFRKADTADKLTHAYAQAESIKLPLKVIETLLDSDGWCPYRKELSQKNKQNSNVINLDEVLDHDNSHALEIYKESGKKRKHNPLAQETPQNKKHKADEEITIENIADKPASVEMVLNHQSPQPSPDIQTSSSTIPDIAIDDIDNEANFLENFIAEKFNDTPSDNLETLIHESVSQPAVVDVVMNDEQPSTSADNANSEVHRCEVAQTSSTPVAANSPDDDHLYIDDIDNEANFLENLIAEKFNDTPSDNLETLIHETVSQPAVLDVVMNDEQPSTSADNTNSEVHRCEIAQTSSTPVVANSPDDDHLYNEILNDYLTQSPEQVTTQLQAELKTCPSPDNQSTTPANNQPAAQQEPISHELPTAQDNDFEDLLGDLDNILDQVGTNFDYQAPENSLASLVPKSGPNAGIFDETGTNSFTNAVLQILSNMPALEKFLMQNSYEKNSSTGTLIEFFNMLRTQKTPVQGSALLRSYFNSQNNVQSIDSEQQNITNFAKKFILQFDNNMSKIFATKLTANLVCHAHQHRVSKLGTLRGIMLPIPIKNIDVKLQILINDFMNCRLDFDRCRVCPNKGVNASASIHTLPEILTFITPRLTPDAHGIMQRNRINIFPDDTIVMNDDKGNHTYQLRGMILKLIRPGNKEEYVSLVKDSQNNKWYDFTNHEVKEINNQIVKQGFNSTFMLFYERINLPATTTNNDVVNKINPPKQISQSTPQPILKLNGNAVNKDKNQLPSEQNNDFEDLLGDLDNILDQVGTNFGYQTPENSLVNLTPKSGPNTGIFDETGKDSYLNSILQILSNIPVLEKNLTQNKYDKNSMTGKLIKFFNKLRTEKNPVSGSGLIYKNFLEMLKLDPNTIKNPVPIVLKLLSEVNNDISNIFTTGIIQTRICKNNHLISRTSGLAAYLPLTLPDHMNNTNISSLLSKSMNFSTINSSCPECNTNIIGNRITIQKYPEILALGMNRWKNINNTVQHDSTMVHHNEKIIFNNGNNMYSYELIGMILELGNYNNRRYVSCVKDSRNHKWYQYEYTLRTELPHQVVTQVSNTTSMLFYQRFDKPAEAITSNPMNNQMAPNQSLRNTNSVQQNKIELPARNTSNVLNDNPKQTLSMTSIALTQDNPESSLLNLAPKAIPNSGIINESGSDCFMSATLQVLSNIKALNQVLTKNKYNPGSVIETLKSFFDTLRSEQNPVSGSEQLRHNLVTYMSQYTGHRNMATGQHDAHEFITTLLSGLDDEIKNIFNTELSFDQTCSSCGNSLTNSSLESSLSLELKDQLTPLTVSALLRNFLNHNENINDYRCEQCTTIGNVNRKVSITKLPEIFMVTAKRFNYENHIAQRINTPIITQKEIQFADKTGIYRYQLMGMILQDGTLLNGHYTAYVKDRLDEKWYYYDDQGRKECALEEIASKSAYIFFYEQVKASPQISFNHNSVINHTQENLSTIINNNNIIDDELIDHAEQTIAEKNLLDISQNSQENFLLSLTPRSNPNAGIINENGTDCFMTTTLQVLSNIPAIETTLIKNSYDSNSIMGTLIAFFNTLRTEKNALAQSSLLRNYLAHALEDERMAIGQHDARQFIIKLLHVLDPEIKTKFNIDINIEQMCGSKEHNSTCSIVERELPLDIPDQPEQVSLKTLVNDLLTKGQYFELFECRGCNDRTGLHRKISIKKLPQILTLSVKRFKHENNEVKRKNTPVSAARTISLSDEDGQHTYELVGMILQTGSLYKGRYMACVKDHNTQKWHKYHDDIRTITSINDLLAMSENNLYMLFYQQIN